MIRKKRSVVKKEKRFNNSIHDFLFFVNWTNRMEHVAEPIATYKAWVGKGNNSILIKNTIKSRFWWNIVDAAEAPPDANLFWTQSRTPKIIEQLRSGDEMSLEIVEPHVLKHSESESPARRTQKNSFVFEVPKEKESKNRTYYGESNGLRKLASSKDLQNSRDNYSVEISSDVPLRHFPPPHAMRAHNHL